MKKLYGIVVSVGQYDDAANWTLPELFTSKKAAEAFRDEYVDKTVNVRPLRLKGIPKVTEYLSTEQVLSLTPRQYAIYDNWTDRKQVADDFNRAYIQEFKLIK